MQIQSWTGPPCNNTASWTVTLAIIQHSRTVLALKCNMAKNSWTWVPHTVTARCQKFNRISQRWTQHKSQHRTRWSSRQTVQVLTNNIGRSRQTWTHSHSRRRRCSLSLVGGSKNFKPQTGAQLFWIIWEQRIWIQTICRNEFASMPGKRIYTPRTLRESQFGELWNVAVSTLLLTVVYSANFGV